MAQVLIRQRRRGMLLLDALGGLLLVAALATVMAIAVNRQARAAQKLADTRAAIRIAERVLADLQLSTQPTGLDEEVRVAIRQTQDGPAVQGAAWVEVDVTFRRQSVRLAGLVPRQALPAEGRGL